MIIASSSTTVLILPPGLNQGEIPASLPRFIDYRLFSNYCLTDFRDQP
jgi:hypothetical protein